MARSLELYKSFEKVCKSLLTEICKLDDISVIGNRIGFLRINSIFDFITESKNSELPGQLPGQG